MNKEKVILSIFATIAGLLVAGVAFYFYESTQTIPQSKMKIISISPLTPTPTPSVFLALNSPDDETVVTQSSVNISGKTTGDATVAILTQSNEQVVKPAITGDFSATVNLDDGENMIVVTAIAPNGESAKITRIITYSTEEF